MMGEYTSEGDDSVFGLMNAVTSVAREEPDPEVRWDLEELGGGIPAMVPDVPKPSDTAADVFQTAFGVFLTPVPSKQTGLSRGSAGEGSRPRLRFQETS